jgi:hypothetical protein
MVGSSLRNMEMFKVICGEDALQNVILVTTMWDEVEESDGISREKALREEYWRPMIASGAKLMRFDHTRESAWHIIDQLSGMRLSLQLQREMVDNGKALHQTAAGRSLFQWFDRLVADLQALIQKIKDGLKITGKGPSAGKNKELVTTKEKELKLAKEQRRKLTQSPSLRRRFPARRFTDPQSPYQSPEVTPGMSHEDGFAIPERVGRFFESPDEQLTAIEKEAVAFGGFSTIYVGKYNGSKVRIFIVWVFIAQFHGRLP